MTFTSEYRWCQVTVDGQVDNELRVLEHSLTSEAHVESVVRITALPNLRLTYETCTERLERTFPSSLARAEWAYRRVHGLVADRAAAEGWQRLHAALVVLHGKSVLIAGKSHAGKTTLAIALGLAGGNVLADEGVYVRGSQVLPMLRRAHVKDSAQRLFDSELFRDAVRLEYDPPLWTLDPAIFSQVSAVGPLSVDFIILLGDRDKVETKMIQVPDAESLGAILTEAAPFCDDVPKLVAETTALLETATVLRLEGHSGRRGLEAIRERV